ncbi:MAG: LacI family transcriptional regulator [Lentisphaerae bacterium]|nr:LacI family transcriptional regulator [Lentisphaerota bacterium]
MTIKDIAREAGVSASTVSRVFNNNPRISSEVSSRVREIARKYNYHPRLPVRQRNVILLIPQESGYPAHYCVERLVMALSGELFKRKFQVEIVPWSNRDNLKNKQFYAAAAIGIDGETFRNWQDDFVQTLVLVDRSLEPAEPGVYQVCADEYGAMKLAAEHFKAHGIHRPGVLIYGSPGSGNSDLRMNGARAAMKAAGFPADAELFHFASPENFMEKCRILLQEKIDAILCPGSSGGSLTAYALHQNRMRIPDDISLIASEVAFFSPFATPPQTSVCPDYTAMADAVVDIFIAVLEGKKVSARTVLPYTLKVRESVKKV